MAKAPANLSNPVLHKSWSSAKATAKKAAAALDKKNKDKDKTQQKTYSALAKSDFKKDLGPNLDKWVKQYPDYPKMEKLLRGEIEPAIKSYSAAIQKSVLDPTIAKPLKKALTDILASQNNRDDQAKELIGSDLELGFEESMRKIPPPIVVLSHPDMLRVVAGKTGGMKNIKVEGKLSIEVIIGDKEILAKFPGGKEYSNASLKIKNAADFSKLVGEIADAAKAADKKVGSGSSVSGEQQTFEAAVDKAVDNCLERATEEAGRLGGLKGKARWANVKRGGKLLLTLAGATAAVAGLALTPFTLGVSTVAGCLGLAKAGVSIGQEVADIASTAEEMANGIAKELNTLKKQYSTWLTRPEVKKAGGVSNKMGMAELTKSAVNALAPTMITTIKTVKSNADTYDEKIDKLEVKSDNLSDNLTDWMSKQLEASQAFEKLKKQGKDALTDNETKVLLKILSNIEKSSKTITKLIKAVTELNQRVLRNRDLADRLSKELDRINYKNPLWSDIGIALFEVTSSVAFTLAGNVNAPDPYKFAKTATTITGAIDTTREQLQQTDALANGLKDAFEKRKKKVKA